MFYITRKCKHCWSAERVQKHAYCKGFKCMGHMMKLSDMLRGCSAALDIAFCFVMYLLKCFDCSGRCLKHNFIHLKSKQNTTTERSMWKIK